MDAGSSAFDANALLAEAGQLHALARDLARDVHGADDLVQDTLLTALERPPRRDEGPGGLRGWLSTVLRNRARQDHRGENRRRAREHHVARPEAVGADAGDVEARMLLLRRLAEAIAALAEPYRSAVTMRWIDGLTPAEVARAQGIRPEAARQRLSRAVAMLRKDLDRRYDGREQWSAIALVFPKSVAASAPASHLLGKGISMSTATKIAAGSLLLLALGIVSWRALRTARPDAASALTDAAVGEFGSSGRTTAPHGADPAAIAADRSAKARAPATSTSGAPSAVETERRLSGVVLDPAGHPVSGAEIEVSRRESDGNLERSPLDTLLPAPPVPLSTARSAEDGTFAFDVQADRPHELTVHARGHADAHVASCYAGEHVVVRLVLGAAVEGTVTRKRDGTPVEQALVQVVEQVTISASRHSALSVVVATNRDGHYRADGLAAGTYWIVVHPPAAPDSELEFVTLTVAGTARFDVAIESGRTITGRVTDEAIGRAVVGAVVGEGAGLVRRTVTDANGNYVLRGVSTRSGAGITVIADGYGSRWIQLPPPAAEPAKRPDSAAIPASADAATDEVQQTLDVKLQAGHVVRARIVDRDGKPIDGARIAAIAQPDGQESDASDCRLGMSGANGKIEIAGVRADLPHVLVVRREGFGTLVYRFPPNERETSTIDFGDIALDPMAILSGVVVDESGKPRPDQAVSLKGSNADRNTRYASAPKAEHARETRLDGYAAARSARTDDVGRFSFVDVAPGEYLVSSTLDGVDDPVEAAVQVSAGARVADVKLVLDEGLTIEGRVFGPDGNPVEKAGIRTTLPLLDPNLPPRRPGMPPSKQRKMGTANASTDAQGRFRLVGLTAGTYRLSVLCWDDHAETRFAPAEIVGVVAGTTDVIVRLRNVSRIEGFVHEADGTPVPRASVYAYVGGRGTTPIVERGQSDGSFFIDAAEGDVADLEAYPEDVRNADASQRAKRSAHVDAIPAGTKGVDLRLPPR